MRTEVSHFAVAAGRAVKWVFAIVVSLLLVSVLIHLALDALPGDAATQRLALEGSPEQIAQLRHQYGLDKPILTRHLNWLAGIWHGDLGTVDLTGKSVAATMRVPVERTLVLSGLAAAGIAVLGIGGGIWAGSRPGIGADRILAGIALFLVCTPEFVVASVLVLIFSGWLGWLPAVSLVPTNGAILDRPSILVLPGIAITLLGSSLLLRQVRSVVQKQSQRPHVEAARLAGLTERQVILRHLLPGAWGPIAQASAAVVPFLVGGVVVIETVFAFPGLGSLLIFAVENREAELLLTCTLLTVATTIIGFVVADLVATRFEVTLD